MHTKPTPEQSAALDRLAAFHTERAVDDAPLAAPRAAVYIAPVNAPDEWQLAARNRDPYTALQAVASLAELVTMPPTALALVTTSTVTPLANPGTDAPQRRATVTTMLDKTRQMVSRVDLDDPKETLYERGTIAGPLAVALASTFAALQNGAPS